jgi:hypothetical protein
MGRREGHSGAVLLEGGDELAHVEETVALLPGLHRARQALPARHLLIQTLSAGVQHFQLSTIQRRHQNGVYII